MDTKKSDNNFMDPVTLSSLISGAVSLIGSAWSQHSTRETNRMMLEQKEKDKIYNSPAESASRLRSAGFSPSLLGLDNSGAVETVPLESNANNILQSARQLSDVASGWSSMYLQKQRNEVESLRNDAEIKHLKNQDELAKAEFDRESLKDVYEFRKMDDEHLANLIKNTDDLSSLAFQSALTGRKPVGLDKETQKKFDEAYSRVNTSSTEFKFAKSAIEKGLSINELDSLMAKQKKEYYNSNPLYDLMRYDETYKRAYNSLMLTRASLSNDALSLENDFNSSVADARQRSALSEFNSRETYNNGYKYHLRKVLMEFNSLDKRLNSEEYLKNVSPAVASMLRQERMRYQNLLEQFFFNGNKINHNSPLPFVGEVLGPLNDYNINPMGINNVGGIVSKIF